MSEQQLFDSKSEPIPPLRRDLQIIPIEEDGSSLLYFHDQRGYTTPDFALKREAGQLISLFDGQKTVNDLASHLGNGVNKEDLLQFIQLLDKNRVLASEYFQKHAEDTERTYEQSAVHSPVTAGGSYPADPDQLKEYLDEAFAKHTDKNTTSVDSAKALYAPHIDPRVALDSYVNAFAPLKNMQPSRVVIIATSHYAGLYPKIYKNTPFILVDKDFELPLATVQRDHQMIDTLAQADAEYGITVHDRAHRMEHSIELHLLFLSYLWSHNFSIVPFLIRGLDDLYYMEDGHLGMQLSNFTTLLQNHFGNDEDTFFLISGDLAHFGNKFGDESPASSMFGEVKNFDQQFLDHASSNNRKQLLELMKEDMDPYRICGFPPLYTFLQSMPNIKGEVLDYSLWDERERNSAVTFGSILYR